MSATMDDVPSGITLRPVAEDDLDVMVRFAVEPGALGEFEWTGFTDATVTRRRWEEDRLLAEDSSYLAVVLDEHTFIGYVVWRDISGAPTRGAPKRLARVLRYGIGIVLLPEYRGKGYGTEAQRQLVDYLFATTPVHRIDASTEAGNVAEQRSLEKVGFQREGVVRAAGYRNGQWVDGVLYGILRDDERPHH
jgi:RimJ/RimL family protein N-acetyltransferase